MNHALRQEFPIFNHHPGLAYLDNASTTQKPRAVIEAEQHFYQWQNANVHRALYPLADAATTAFEQTREKVRAFLGAAQASEIVFTSGSTQAINLVAQSFAGPRLEAGDAVLISALEHHANLIPWQQICRQKNARLLVLPIDNEGVLQTDELPALLQHERVKMLALTHVSNSLGTINPVADIIRTAHRFGVPVLLDAAQSVSGPPLDVPALDADFLVFSAHKLFGPTGVGVLYGKMAWLETMQPAYFGGEMILDVSFERSVFAAPPRRFEAGTPNIAGVVALGAALDFVTQTDRAAAYRHSLNLCRAAERELAALDGLRIIGQAPEKAPIVSFYVEDIHPHDLATWLGEHEICVRAGHHCTQPVMDFFDIPGSVRASFSWYNTADEAERLVDGVKNALRFFRPG